MPPEVSLPMPMQAKMASAKVQLVMVNVFGGYGGVEADWLAASAPRPDLREMQSSPVAMSQ